MKRLSPIVLALLLSTGLKTTARTVETITLNADKKFDGLLVHSDGYLYASDGWGGNAIYKIDNLGIVTRLLADYPVL